MRVMVLVKATEDSEKQDFAPTPENREILEAKGGLNDELRKAGFWLWEVRDMDEAVAWVKRCPNPMPGPSEIEIRPLYEMADLQ